MRPVFLKGKRIYLSRILADGELDDYIEWINDQETTVFLGTGRFPASKADIQKYIKGFESNPNGMLLGIFLNRNSRHIGNIALHMINWKDRHGEIGIIIGDKKSRGKGYATEAIRLVVEHAFNRLNLHKLYAGMVKGNEASKRAFEKVGFRVEGILREHFYLNGQYLDCYRMGLIHKNK